MRLRTSKTSAIWEMLKISDVRGSKFMAPPPNSKLKGTAGIQAGGSSMKSGS